MSRPPVSGRRPPTTPAAAIRRGGRPSLQEAEQLRETIIAVATELFLSDGYGATSIDAIAQRARMSKRTFYHRFKDKAELFTAVVQDLIGRLRPPGAANAAGLAALFTGAPLDEILLRLARLVLHAALQPRAIALQRLLLAEAPRFPELARAAAAEGSRAEAIRHIAALLQREREAGRIGFAQVEFAAEQFLHMLITVPLRRAMGLGTPMSELELAEWEQQTVRLFLTGCLGR